MRRPRHALSLMAILAAAVLVGCGGGGSDSTARSAPASTAASGTIDKAVAECHHLVETQPKLSATTKAKLSDACDKAGKGDTQAVKQVAREVCEEVVSKTSLPASAKETALAACKR